MNTVEVKAEILAALRETLSPRLHSTPVLRSFIDDFAACEITRPKAQAQALAATENLSTNLSKRQKNLLKTLTGLVSL